VCGVADGARMGVSLIIKSSDRRRCLKQEQPRHFAEWLAGRNKFSVTSYVCRSSGGCLQSGWRGAPGCRGRWGVLSGAGLYCCARGVIPLRRRRTSRCSCLTPVLGSASMHPHVCGVKCCRPTPRSCTVLCPPCDWSLRLRRQMAAPGLLRALLFSGFHSYRNSACA